MATGSLITSNDCRRAAFGSTEEIETIMSCLLGIHFPEFTISSVALCILFGSTDTGIGQCDSIYEISEHRREPLVG